MTDDRPTGARHIVVDARIIRSSTGRYVERLLTHLEQLDEVNRYTVLVGSDDADYWTPRSPNFTVRTADIAQYSFAEQYRFADLLRRLKPDLVHFCMPQQPLLHRGRKVTTIHDLTLLRTYNSDKNWLVFHVKQLVFRGLLSRLVRTNSALIVPSEHTRRDVERYWPAAGGKITVTPEAADLPAGDPREYPLPFDDYLLYVGQQKDYKNLRRLARAHQSLLARHPNLGLVCVGRIDKAAARNQEVFDRSGYRNIVLTGFLPDDHLAWLYQNCRAYVFPSLMEGFGLPGLEAMAHGAPVVCSNRTSLPEVYGDAAAYFDPEDVADMARAVDSVLTDPERRARLVERGRERVGMFSWRRTAEQTLAVYRAVFAEPMQGNGVRAA